MTEDEWLDDITDSMDISEQIVGENEGQKKPGVLQTMGS